MKKLKNTNKIDSIKIGVFIAENYDILGPHEIANVLTKETGHEFKPKSVSEFASYLRRKHGVKIPYWRSSGNGFGLFSRDNTREMVDIVRQKHPNWFK